MAEEQASKGKSKIVIIIAVILIIVALLLGAVFYFMTKGSTQEDNSQMQSVSQNNSTTDAQTNGSIGSKNYIRVGPTYQLDQFIVNLLTQSGRRYLKVTMSLEMTTPSLQNELSAKLPAIRDTIIDILSSKSLEDVSTTRGKEKIKEEIVQRLNEFLVDGKIRNVFFIDSAIQ